MSHNANSFLKIIMGTPEPNMLEPEDGIPDIFPGASSLSVESESTLDGVSEETNKRKRSYELENIPKRSSGNEFSSSNSIDSNSGVQITLIAPESGLIFILTGKLT